jgi:hypothetical protein
MASSLPEPWLLVEGMVKAGGGQGDVLCVQHPGDVARYALKRLLNPKRCGRFVGEVDTMRKLRATYRTPSGAGCSSASCRSTPTSPAMPVLQASGRATPAAATPAQRTAAGPADRKGRIPHRVYKSKRSDRGGLVLSVPQARRSCLETTLRSKCSRLCRTRVRLRIQALECPFPAKREEIWSDTGGSDEA